MTFKGHLKAAYRTFRSIITDNKRRIRLQHMVTYMVLCVISLFMTVLNVITEEKVVMMATIAFSAVCAACVIIGKHSQKGLSISGKVFQVGILCLITFFIVTGSPDGFSAIWAAMIPAYGLLLFELKYGAIFCAELFAIVAFFFWTPLGKSLLMYDYNETFMMRFPILYLAFFALAVILELVRDVTFKNYTYLYTHDTLTGALNRNGFNDIMSMALRNKHSKYLTFMIFDLDHFKEINDTYGHMAGDEVLKQTAEYLKELTGLSICRWGGEEFAAVDSTGMFTEETARAVVELFSKKPFRFDETVINMTVSLGVIRTENKYSVTTDELTFKADKALYRAKETGRNRAVFHDETLDRKSVV